jgi:hypothetical protein
LRPGPEARALLLRCVLLAGRNFYASKRRRQDHEAAHVRNRDSFSKSEHSRDNLQSAVKLALQRWMKTFGFQYRCITSRDFLTQRRRRS